MLSRKDSALCEVTKQWQTLQLALGGGEKKVKQVSGQHIILYQVSTCPLVVEHEV